MKVKKFLSIMMSFLLALTAMTAFSLSASAKENILTSGKQKSITLKTNGNQITYRIDTIGSGNLTLDIDSDIMWIDLWVLDSNKNAVKPTSHSDTNGQAFPGKDYTDLDWEYSKKSINISLTYKVTKGTYYITFVRENNKSNTGNGNITFTATFPAVTISYLSFTLPKGSTTQMGAVLSGKSDEKVSWSSSDRSVATVNSKGKITAKAKGKAVITAKLGDSVMKIQIKVTE